VWQSAWGTVVGPAGQRALGGVAAGFIWLLPWPGTNARTHAPVCILSRYIPVRNVFGFNCDVSHHFACFPPLYTQRVTRTVHCRQHRLLALQRGGARGGVAACCEAPAAAAGGGTAEATLISRKIGRNRFCDCQSLTAKTACVDDIFPV